MTSDYPTPSHTAAMPPPCDRGSQPAAPWPNMPVATPIVHEDMRTIPVDAIHANDYNPNELPAFEYGRLLLAIKTYGFLDPLTVIQDGADFQVVDGEHRLQAARELGLAAVPCVIAGDTATVSPARQRALTLLLNELKGRHDEARTREILRDIQGLAAHDEPIVLPYPDIQIAAFLRPDIRRNDGALDFDQHLHGTTRRRIAPHTGWQTLTFSLPPDAATVVQDALNAAREQGAGDEDWQCLEAIAADFVASGGAQDGA